MAKVVFRTFDEAFEAAQAEADASGEAQAVLRHETLDRFAVQPRELAHLWVAKGWLVEDDRFEPAPACRCDGNCGGTGECRFDF